MTRRMLPEVACRTGLVDFASGAGELVDAAAARSDSAPCSGVSVVCCSSVTEPEGPSGVSGSARDMLCACRGLPQLAMEWRGIGEAANHKFLFKGLACV